VAGEYREWADIKQDVKALQEITIEDNGKTLAVRSECIGACGKVFQAVGIAMPRQSGRYQDLFNLLPKNKMWC